MESINRPTFEHSLNFRFMLLLITILSVLFVFSDALAWMYKAWTTKEEYSHGIMIPFVSAYLLWQRRDEVAFEPDRWSAIGYVLLIIGFCFHVISVLAGLYVGSLIAFMFCLYGVLLLAIGGKTFKSLSGPLFILLLMLPLPTFLYNNLSSFLQLISSQLGVAFIRLFDISVYLEGNVIDLGSYKLQVVEACSGLRYLFPLMSLGFILAYVSDMPLWKKVCLFVATVPITVVMNSIRVGGIGVTVEYWGPSMAEGLLHDIEGWFMFMASLAVLLVFLWGLLRISGDKRSALSVVSAGLNYESSKHEGEERIADHKANPENKISARFHWQVGSAIGLVVCFAALTSIFQKEQVKDLPRISLNHFPLIVGDWVGTPDALEQLYIDELKFDDYMIADYTNGAQHLNFYMAYYDQQSAGQSAHSPRSCIPGGGWRINAIEQVHLGEMYLNSQPLLVNRAIIQKGDARQVVYYWFQQRGRIISNEYLVKWYLFVDALSKNRTDGALVRLTTPLKSSQDISEADAVAEDFMQSIQFRLNDYIPN